MSWSPSTAVTRSSTSETGVTSPPTGATSRNWAVLCLRVLQAAVTYVNTLMIQDVLSDPDWADVLAAEDKRGLTPLFWSHLAPYGEVKLDMRSRLTFRAGAPAADGNTR
jgi:hypothetical protein